MNEARFDWRSPVKEDQTINVSSGERGSGCLSKYAELERCNLASEASEPR